MARSNDEINAYILAHSATETDVEIGKHLRISADAVRGRRRRMNAVKPMRSEASEYRAITHLVIPDTQVKEGVPTAHLGWIGQYIAEHQPHVIVHLGDHWDMPSLSSYDKGKKSFEGRRYAKDVKAGNDAFELIDAPMRDVDGYRPRKVVLRGNHEYRIQRAIEENAVLDGVIGYDDLETLDWEVHDFLEVVNIDGVAYSHYFYNPLTGRPYGGQVATRLKTIGHSFTMGHQQVLDMSLRFVNGKSQHGLVCGSCYLHDEDYLGYQGNSYWRGIIVCHEVHDGSYDLMLVSLEYLCRRYEGMTLEEYMS